MSIRVYVPSDSTAVSLGANKIASALPVKANAQGQAVDIVRNGSRGLFWLEPLLEVETPQGRVAYGPVTLADLDSLLKADFLNGSQEHPLCQGFTESIPYLQKQ